MTDETKRIFNAPWYPDRATFELAFVVKNIDGKEFAKSSSPDTVKRLARLPGLYDALMETVYLKCFECMGGLRHNIDLTREEIVKNGCPKQNKSNVCIYVKHIELLRKVRAGE